MRYNLRGNTIMLQLVTSSLCLLNSDLNAFDLFLFDPILQNSFERVRVANLRLPRLPSHHLLHLLRDHALGARQHLQDLVLVGLVDEEGDGKLFSAGHELLPAARD